MGFSWFRVDAAVIDHPKVMELAARLDEPLALTYVIRLWSWAQRYAPTGAFSARAVPQLEAHLGRKGVIEVMREVRLVDRVGDTEIDSNAAFLVHDWPEMQGGLVEKSRRDAELKRKRRRTEKLRPARAAPAGGAASPPARTDVTDETRRDETYDERSVLPVSIVAPTTDPRTWSAEDFWRWAQSRRGAAGFVVEKMVDSRRLGAWYSATLLTLNGDVDRLKEAFLNFGDDPYWQKPKQPPPLPFNGFMSQWDRYVPRGPRAS